MKVLFTLLLLITTSTSIFSQSNLKTTYLLVRMDELYDNFIKKQFIKIHAEGGNPYAGDVYNLQVFETTKNAINGDYQYYEGKKDTVAPGNLYNYFGNTTQALMYMAGKGWELVNVATEISSSVNNERDGNGIYTPVSAVSSRLSYFFKKTVPNN